MLYEETSKQFFGKRIQPQKNQNNLKIGHD